MKKIVNKKKIIVDICWLGNSFQELRELTLKKIIFHNDSHQQKTNSHDMNSKLVWVLFIKLETRRVQMNYDFYFS